MQKGLKLKLVIILIIAAAAVPVLIVFSSKNLINKSIKLSARSAVVMNMDQKKVLFEAEKDKRLSPGSMTKLMSVLLVFEKIQSGELLEDDIVVVSENAAQTFASKVGLKVGERMSVKNLLKCVLIPSGSDAMIALAEHLYKTEERFVAAMNEKAKSMGLKNTHFTNCVGLEDAEHYSSAYDVALIACELAAKFPQIYDYTSLSSAKIPREDKSDFFIVNTNDMLKERSINGMKTGSTPNSGFSITITGTKGKNHIVAVVMNCVSPVLRRHDCLILTKRFFD